jgi:hypothetical protein
MDVNKNVERIGPPDVELRGGDVAEDCRRLGQREVRREIVGIAVARRSGPASVYRHVRRNVYDSIEGSDRGVSFMAVGSLV